MATINQQDIKSMNMKKLYRLIQDNKNISRARLAKATELSKATVSALVDELIENQYVLDCGQNASASIGRKPNALKLDGEHCYVAVFHWHTSRIHAVLINLEESIVFEKQLSIDENTNYAQVTSRILHEDLETFNPQARILGVCIIVPAMINAETQEIFSTVLGHGFQEILVLQLQNQITDYPIAILNDTSCYAYAECIHNNMNNRYFSFINISRGVGAVLIDHGKMFRGANGMTTQFGHFSIERSGPLCDCGNHGCLECMVGEAYIYKRAQDWNFKTLFSDESEASFEYLGGQIAHGNGTALEFMRVLAENVAYAISNLISLFNPQEIVFGGGCVALGDPFLTAIKKSLDHMGFPPFERLVELRFTRQNRSFALIGAARYYIDQYFMFSKEMEQRLYIG